MALPVVGSFKDRVYIVGMTDISTASSAFFSPAFRGKIVGGFATIENAITGADSGLTAKINGTAITGFTGTAVNAGSAAGTVFTMATPTGANIVAAGDSVELISDGASSTAAVTKWTIVVREF